MKFSSAGEQQKALTLLCLRTDGIDALAIRKEQGKTTVVEQGTEPLEAAFAGANLNAEQIVVNAGKALQKLSPAARKRSPLVAALGGGLGSIAFVRVKGSLGDEAKKISQEDTVSLTGKWYGPGERQKTTVFENIPQRFFVDGFPVPDPVGLAGKEISIDMVSIAHDAAITAALEAFAASAGMQWHGVGDLRLAAAMASAKRHSGDALAVLVWEREVNAVLVRGGSVLGIGTGTQGYGILIRSIAESFGVGMEEARHMLEEFRAGSVAGAPAEQLRELENRAHEAFVVGVASAVRALGVEDLLPGNVIVADSSESAEWREALRDPVWAKSMPFARGLTVHISDVPVTHLAVEHL